MRSACATRTTKQLSSEYPARAATLLTPRFPQVALALLLVAVALIAAIAVHQWLVQGTMDPILLVRLSLVLLGLLVLARATLGRPASPAPQAARCARCGGATFETRRSTDRETVVTCFACGFEGKTSDPSGGEKPPRTPRSGEPGRAH